MSLLQQLKRRFAGKVTEPEVDTRLGVSVPDASTFELEDELKSSQTQYGPPQVLPEHSDPTGSVDTVPMPPTTPAKAQRNLVLLPFLGARPVAQHQRVLSVLLLLWLAVLVLVAVLAWRQSSQVSRQLQVIGQTLMQSQRLAKLVTQAVAGDAAVLSDATQSARSLSQSLNGLRVGDDELALSALAGDFRPALDRLQPLGERTEKATTAIAAQHKLLLDLGVLAMAVRERAGPMLELAEAIALQKVQQGAPAAEVLVANRIAVLTQRMARSAAELTSVRGADAAAVVLIGQDLQALRQLTRGLLEGATDLRLSASTDGATRERLQALLKQTDTIASGAVVLSADMSGLAQALTAARSISADSELMRRELQALQDDLSRQTALGAVTVAGLAILGLLALLTAVALTYVQLLDSRQRQVDAETLRMEAQFQEQEAKRINDANQAAILRLMNELQGVAEGDLTQQATVTEDITGAIADSINYTVEELRSLVGSVQNTADKVAQTTSEVDLTSTELLAASNEQLLEIRETGQSVVDLASRINSISSQAQESANVARQSLHAARQGLQAVENTIGGMNTLRDQIQDTAKRIKRLGESSQEIGEITELISDITEQTNVLALNAAIQAASAGDAGRGFSVVAEEVQRLAERSADATRQIAALVKTIQTDTQDAVGAMERSTQGVVEGARLSDNAGAALTQIDQVSRRLAELIEQFSASTSQEANMANDLAGNIQHIFAVTEQTGDGTRSTAAQVRELSRMAEELRQSVARFRIG